MSATLMPGDLVLIEAHYDLQWNGKLGMVIAKEPGTFFNWLVLVDGTYRIFNEHFLRVVSPDDNSLTL